MMMSRRQMTVMGIVAHKDHPKNLKYKSIKSPSEIPPNYLRMAKIPIVHHTSV